MRVRLKEQIGALCDARQRGLTKHIGVSNFPVRYVETAIAVADEPLVTNQVEHHPWLDQARLFEVCGRHGISITSHSPLGRGALLRERAIDQIARSKGATPAQVVLRWHVQQPMNIAIPRSSNPKRIAENLAIFDFELSEDEMRRISGLARPDGRVVEGSVDWDGDPP
jgi:diketogulonate reductase-like aldo/keto reductase